ncbi:MAG TPA: hypothetical protein VHE55_17870 [Fimbriimonadaceae bacterium]|nr:hypothetical protein [Fimbriimonadaceae bacterium]
MALTLATLAAGFNVLLMRTSALRGFVALIFAFLFPVRGIGGLLAARFAAFLTDLGHVLAILADGFATLAPDLGHVLTILADSLATGMARADMVFVRSSAVM